MNAMATIKQEAPCSWLNTRENTAWLEIDKMRSARAEFPSQRIRKGKVLRIKRQLAEGKYEFERHLSAALDVFLASHICENIIGPMDH